MLELDLTESMSPNAVAEALAVVLPAGLSISRIEQVDCCRRARVRSVRYHLEGSIAAGDVDRCMEQTKLEATRQDGKQVDIRPYLQDIRCSDGGCDVEVLVTSEGTARPAEIAAALSLGECPSRVSIVRTAVNIEEDQQASPSKTV